VLKFLLFSTPIIALLIIFQSFVSNNPSYSNGLTNISPLTLVTPAVPGIPIVSTQVAITKTAGTVIPLPSSQTVGLKLINVTENPLIPVEVAQLSVANIGISWALGGEVDGKPIILSATYGSGTFGGYTNDGKNWVGPMNFPVRNCSSDGKCTPTGQVLEHIENRLMWILDYGNAKMTAVAPPSQACKSVACTPVPDFNHSVYAVDALTKDVILIWFYYGR